MRSAMQATRKHGPTRCQLCRKHSAKEKPNEYLTPQYLNTYYSPVKKKRFSVFGNSMLITRDVDRRFSYLSLQLERRSFLI